MAQISTASSGCCIGQTSGAGTLPPNNLRQDAAIALIGFQLAKARSQEGMPWVGTNAVGTNDSGRKNTNPMACAVSGLRSSMPAQAPTQVIANANSRASPAA